MANYDDTGRQVAAHREERPIEYYVPPPKRRVSFTRVMINLILIFFAAGILLSLVFAVGVARTGQDFLNNVAGLFAPAAPAPTPTPKIDVGPIVLNQIQGLSELTTSQMGMQTVVSASKSQNLGPFSFDTRLLYVAYGEVRAGIDLSLLGPADVQVQDNLTATIKLPSPKILDSKIDVNRSYVYDYQQGIFSPQAPELQTEAERQALDQIIAGACDSNILADANEKAELAISKLLSAMGIKQITVLTQMPDDAANPCANIPATVPRGIPTPATPAVVATPSS